MSEEMMTFRSSGFFADELGDLALVEFIDKNGLTGVVTTLEEMAKDQDKAPEAVFRLLGYAYSLRTNDRPDVADKLCELGLQNKVLTLPLRIAMSVFADLAKNKKEGFPGRQSRRKQLSS